MLDALLDKCKKSNILRALGCDEKYLNGAASDFEFFDMWEQMLPLAAGHSVVELYRKELLFMGLSSCECGEYSREESIARWRAAHGAKQRRTPVGGLADFDIYCDISARKKPIKEEYDIKKSMSKNIKKCGGFFDLVSAISEDIDRLKNSEITAVIDLCECRYVRPDIHTATLAFNKEKCGEKCNPEESFVLVSEVLIELLKNKKIHRLLILPTNDISNANALLSYLKARRFFEGCAIVCIDSETNICVLDEMSERLYPQISVYPMIGRGDEPLTEDRLISLFESYPIGAFYVDRNADSLCVNNAINRLSQNELQRDLLSRLLLDC